MTHRLTWTFFVFIALSLSQRPGASAEDTPLHIACNLPLTGELATYGAAIQEGAMMAVDEMKLQGRLSFDWQDNASTTRQAAEIAARQLGQKPDIYVSGLRPQYMTTHDIVMKSAIPHFPWIFDMHIRPAGERNFRTWVNFKAESPLFLRFAAERKAARVGVIYVQLPHTEEQYAGTIIPGLKAQGAEVLVEPYDMNKMDFRDIAVRMARFKPEALILSGFQANFVGLIKALRQLNLIGANNTAATYDLVDALPLLSPDETEGISISAMRIMLRPTPRYEEWKKRFLARFNREPLYTHVGAYEMVELIAKATEAQKNMNSAELTRALQETRVESISGALSFDPEGDVATPIELGVVQNGKLVAWR